MLTFGMMWFDNDPLKSLAEKLAEAVNYYLAKYKQVPNLCYANPLTLQNQNAENDYQILVMASETILPNHLWLGISDT